MKVRQQQAGNRGYCHQQGNEFQRMMYDENNVITGEQRETKVSVIMPVYNGQDYVGQAIQSVLEQSWNEILELIIIDDHSDDQTAEVISGFLTGKETGRCSISFYQNSKNLGVAECRNIGIRKAKSPYVAFLDADDWWNKEKLERQFAVIEKTGCVLCATGRELVTHDGIPTGKKIGIPQQLTYKQLLKTNVIPCSSVVMRTDVAREFYMCRDDLHEDYILWLRVLKKYKTAVGIDEPLIKSRLSRGGKSRNKLKSAKMQFGVYRYMGFGVLKSLYYFCHYAVNGVLKYR